MPTGVLELVDRVRMEVKVGLPEDGVNDGVNEKVPPEGRPRQFRETLCVEPEVKDTVTW
jgi:hypothetical protein